MTTLQPQISTAGFITGSWIPTYPTTPAASVTTMLNATTQSLPAYLLLSKCVAFFVGYSMRQRRAHRHEDATTKLELVRGQTSSRANCICADNTIEVVWISLCSRRWLDIANHHGDCKDRRIYGQNWHFSSRTDFQQPPMLVLGTLSLYWDCTVLFMHGHNNNLLLLLTRERDQQGTE